MSKKKLKTRRQSRLRVDYSKQYQRVQKSVSRMNTALGAKIIINPLPKPKDVKRVTAKKVKEAKEVTTRKLAKQVGGYGRYSEKVRESETLEQAYKRHYKRIQNAVRKINNIYGREVVLNPLTKPSETEVTMRDIEKAASITTHTLADVHVSYQDYIRRVREKTREEKARKEAMEKIKPTKIEVPELSPENNITQSEMDDIDIENLFLLISQYDTPSAQKLEEIVNREIASKGKHRVAAALNGNPELYEIAQHIVVYEGNVGNYIHEFIRMLGAAITEKDMQDIEKIQYESDFIDLDDMDIEY